MSLWEAIWKSIVLGTVQGLTEFLPVSSSGHLTFLQRVLGYDLAGGGMMFTNIMLHFGTLISVCIVFRKDIRNLFRKPFITLLMLIVATIPAGIVGLLCNDYIDAAFAGKQGMLYLAICFAVTALMLLVTELVAKNRKKHTELGWKNSIAMGLMQTVALFPGISRSGSTIFAGTVSGTKPEKIAKFSFLMSIPIILGSFAVEMKDIVFPAEGAALALGVNEIVGMLVGVVFAAVSGLFAIKVMLKIINKANYKWFSLYLVLLSLTCFWLDALAVL
jgi:undecaprenyl-diphosphatase